VRLATVQVKEEPRGEAWHRLKTRVPDNLTRENAIFLEEVNASWRMLCRGMFIEEVNASWRMLCRGMFIEEVNASWRMLCRGMFLEEVNASWRMLGRGMFSRRGECLVADVAAGYVSLIAQPQYYHRNPVITTELSPPNDPHRRLRCQGWTNHLALCTKPRVWH
jgi:hypothetical protein